MKQKKFFGLLIVTALIAIILLGSSPTSAAPFTQSATQTRTATATTVITPTNTTVPPAAPTVVTPTKTTVPPSATTVVTPTKTSTPVPATATPPKPTATQVVTPTTAKPTATVTPTAVVSPIVTVTKTVTVTATKTATPTATKAAPTATPTKPKVLAPRAGTVAALSTAFTLQNMDAATTANVTATFYDPSGSIPAGSGATCNILPYRNCTVDQRVTGGGLDGQTNWQGSVVLSSNTQLAAVVSEYAGNAASLGRDFRADTYNGWSSVTASNNVSIPQLLKGIYDGLTNVTYNSSIAIQNTSAIVANVTVTYKRDPGWGGGSWNRVATIPARASLMISLESESALSSLTVFYGSGTVTSDQPVAVIVQQNGVGVLQVLSGFKDTNAATTLFLPQLLKNIYDTGTALTYGSGVLVLSADGTPANVTMTYTNLLNGAVRTETQTASPSATFDQRLTSALADQPTFYGSGVLTANKPIIAAVSFVVNYDAARGLRSASYRAFTPTGGASTVFVPLLRKNALDSGTGVQWGSGVLGRLMGSGSTTITITYYHSNGNTYTSTVNVSSSSPMFTIDQRFGTMPDGTMSAVLTSSPPLPFNVIVNTVGPSLTVGDASMTYSGVIP